MDKYSLKWNDFQSTVTGSFASLRQEKDFFDVTLVSDDQVKIPAHKLILSASSSFFKNLLKGNDHSHPMIYLNGVDSWTLDLMVGYVYSGEVQLLQDQLDTFMEVAQKMKIQGLITDESGKPPAQPSDNKSSKTTLNESIDDLWNQEVQNDSKALIDPQNIKEEKKRRGRPVGWKKSQSEGTVAIVDTGNGELESKMEEILAAREGKSGPLTCTICFQVQRAPSLMRRHLEVHFDGLNYSCNLCVKTFRSGNVLRTHKFREHMGATTA